jgi:myo-inositol 2-dehydrogenase/D-chiro-inositol 1-dehydrogenase
MLQAGNHGPTEVTAYTKTAVARDLPLHFFLERIARRTRTRWRISSPCSPARRKVRTTIDDGLKALGARRSRDDVVARGPHRQDA